MFYFDGVGFAHKTNPYAEAHAQRNMSWRKHSEEFSITTKGKMEGSGGKIARLLGKQFKWKVTEKTLLIL